MLDFTLKQVLDRVGAMLGDDRDGRHCREAIRKEESSLPAKNSVTTAPTAASSAVDRNTTENIAAAILDLKMEIADDRKYRFHRDNRKKPRIHSADRSCTAVGDSLIATADRRNQSHRG